MREFNILIIDDNQDLASGLAVILQTEGYKTDVAFNGKDGTSMFYSNLYDLVLLDAKMPDANGIELSHKFTWDKPDCRIIIITGYRIEQLITETLNGYHASVLRQPFDIHQLHDCIKKSDDNIIILPDSPDNYGKQLSSLLYKNNINHIVLNDSTDIDTIKCNNEFSAIITNLKIPITSLLIMSIELNNRNIRLPLIIVLSHSSAPDKKRNMLRDLDITGCLFKPFEPDILLEAIADMSNDPPKKSYEH